MSHHFKIEPRPHKNRDGSLSTSKKDYVVVDRCRSGRVVVGVASSLRAANSMVDEARALFIQIHADKHPNDVAFLRKHQFKGA